MINDNNVTIRELGFWRILKARQKCEETSRHPSIIRQFKVPEINIKAENYTELLPWESDHQRTESPITMAISKEELFAYIKHKKNWIKNCLIFHATLRQLNGASNWSLKHLLKCMEKRAETVLYEQQMNSVKKRHDLSQRKN